MIKFDKLFINLLRYISNYGPGSHLDSHGYKLYGFNEKLYLVIALLRLVMLPPWFCLIAAAK